MPVAVSTALLFDFVREQESERHRVNNLLEVGLGHVLPGQLTLAGGAGVGVGNSETDFRVLIGPQKSF